MLRSLYAGISGLDAFQTFMDVVANNIANVNTVGFKAGQVTFADLISQTLAGAGAPVPGNGGAPGQGGTNPVQVGLGAKVAAIATNMSQGSLQQTGINTDLAIQGAGFFMVQDASGTVAYTRDGAFSLDAAGNLVTADGHLVMGWMANGGTLPSSETAGNAGPIQITQAMQIMAPTASTSITLGGNLTYQAGANVSTVATVYDSLGRPQQVAFTFSNPTQTASGTSWSLTVSWNNHNLVTGQTVQFNASGAETSPATVSFSFTPQGAQTLNLTANLSGLTGYFGQTAITATANGNPPGTLESISFDPSGTLTGTYSNGLKQTLAQLALADFTNPGGLEHIGGNLFAATPNAGPQGRPFLVGPAGSGGLGTLVPGALEMSNVDLSQEFTNMIVAERSYQADAQVITASDTLLQTLVQIR